MTKQERAEFTIDYIRNRTEGVPDEFLPNIGQALQEGIKLGEKDMLRKVLNALADFNSDQARLHMCGAMLFLSQVTIDLVKFEQLMTEED